MMDNSQIAVIVLGAAAIVFVGWFFMGKRAAVEAVADAGGAQEIDITVKGGYTPDRIAVRSGRPIRLNFYRDETSSCSEQVVFGDFGVVRDLPAYKTTTVDLPPAKPGEYGFACGMNMLHGKIIVR
jgi:plastocyanin domain-containing protein